MGEAQDEELARMKPFDKFSSIHFGISCSSVVHIEYIRPIGGFLSASSGIS